MFIDVPFLKSIDVCDEQIELFTTIFPNGCEVTRDNLETAQNAGLDLEWLGEKMFGEERYNAATAGPRIVYYERMMDARAAYNAAALSAQKMYEAAMEEAHAAYVAAMIEPRAGYNAAFIDAILSLV